MMTGILTGNSLPVLFYETLVFGAVTGFAIYDLIYRRVPDRRSFYFAPLRLPPPFCQALVPLAGRWFLKHGLLLLPGPRQASVFFSPPLLSLRTERAWEAGDIKLAGIMGFIYGLNRMTAILLTAAALAAIAVFFTRRNNPYENLAIPFVPFLAMGNLVIAAALKF